MAIQTSIYLDDDVFRALEEKRWTERVTKTSVINEALRIHLGLVDFGKGVYDNENKHTDEED
jgi:hypothetical protein